MQYNGNIQVLVYLRGIFFVTRLFCRSSRLQMFFIIDVLKHFAIFTGKHLCWSLFLIKQQACNFIKKETPTQVFSCEHYENFKNSFFTEHFGWLLHFVISFPLVSSFHGNGLFLSPSENIRKPIGFTFSGVIETVNKRKCVNCHLK